MMMKGARAGGLSPPVPVAAVAAVRVEAGAGVGNEPAGVDHVAGRRRVALIVGGQVKKEGSAGEGTRVKRTTAGREETRQASVVGGLVASRPASGCE